MDEGRMTETSGSLDGTMTNASRENNHTVFTPKHPLLNDVVLKDVLSRVMGPLSLKDALAYRGVCEDWRNCFQPKLHKAIENQLIVFEQDNLCKLSKKIGLSTYQRPMPLDLFLRLRRDAAKDEPFSSEIQFRRFRFSFFPYQDEQTFDRQFFKEFGPSILELQLPEYCRSLPLGKQVSAYLEILSSCQNLETLALEISRFNTESIFEIGNETHPRTNIKKLTFNCSSSLYISISSIFLKIFLLACPHLESLKLKSCGIGEFPSAIQLQGLPFSRTLKDLHLREILSPMEFYPFMSSFRLQSLTIGFVSSRKREDVDGFFRILESQSQSLELLSIEQFYLSQSQRGTGADWKISSPVMQKLKHLSMNLDDILYYEPTYFSTLFPNLKTLVIGRTYEPLEQNITVISDLHRGVESLELRITLIDTSSQMITFPGKFSNLKILEISIHLTNLPIKQGIRSNFWESLLNLETLYLTVEFYGICLKDYRLGQLFSGLSEMKCKRLDISNPSARLTPADESKPSIIKLKKLKHLGINLSFISSRSQSLSNASFWAFSKLPVLAYFKVSSFDITDEQISMLETAHPLLHRKIIKDQKDDVIFYEWKIPGVSDPPQKPSELFEDF